MSYAKAIQHTEEAPAQVRTDYRCVAHGCPNMGAIGGRYGINRSGSCYFHYIEADHLKWGEVTRRILADDSMRDPVYRASTITTDKQNDGQRAWAYALQARERTGERLTLAQRTMWRDALQWLQVEAAKREPVPE